MAQFISKANMEAALIKIKEYADEKFTYVTPTTHYVVINGTNNIYTQNFDHVMKAGTIKLNIAYMYNGTQYNETLTIDVTIVNSVYKFNMSSNNFKLASGTANNVSLVQFTKDGLSQSCFSIIFNSINKFIRIAGYQGTDGIFKSSNVNIAYSYTEKEATETDVVFTITASAGSGTGKTGYAITIQTPYGTVAASEKDNNLNITTKFTTMQISVGAARPGATIGQNIITTVAGTNAVITPTRLNATVNGGGQGTFTVTWPDNTKAGGLAIVLI